MRVVIFAGPTGGHFFPALAAAESLKKKHPEAEILFVTGRRGGLLVEKARSRIEAQFRFLPDFPFPRTKGPDFIIQVLPFLIKLCASFIAVNRIFNEFRPELCMGFGSYIAFPGILVSRMRKIPGLIHEQNYEMGKANAWLARSAVRAALSFEGKAGTVTGLPLRAALLEAAARQKSRKLTAGGFRIMIVGGSQGAQGLNELWKKTLQLFSHEEKMKLAVTHITGEKDFSALKTMYQENGIRASVFPFYDSMEELYSETDLALTRAGAGTLFELAAFGVPALVVPYPHAEAHQEKNAIYFEKRGGVRVLPEKTSTPLEFKMAVTELMNSEPLRNQMSQAIGKLALPDAGDKLAEICGELLMKEVCAA